jgi:uncharacterized protein (DUF2141 family)
MNKKVIVFILLLLARNGFADEPSGDLVVLASGFPHDRGQVVANLFREGDEVMKMETAYLRTQGKISNKQAQLVFRNLKYGTYAVTVFHDENSNGILDHNLLRMPAEPLGFSNGFQLGIFSGLPSFEKLQFVFKPGSGPVSITVR